MKLIAIVVLYKCRPEDSLTLSSLAANYSAIEDKISEFEVIIFDNSPEQIDIAVSRFYFPFRFQYISDIENKGLAVAYNYAFEVAKANSAEWLLLLDQDSELPPLFMNHLMDRIEFVNDKANIAAIVPKVYFRGTLFSPSKVFYGGIHRPIRENVSGEVINEVCAVGSATTVKISFLSEIGGFNTIFWLDCLDRWLYLMIYKKGRKVFVSDTLIEHNLSVLDYGLFIDEKRYWNILAAESILIGVYRSKGEHLVYLLRLFGRIITFFPNAEKRKYILPTLYAIRDFCLKKTTNNLK